MDLPARNARRRSSTRAAVLALLLLATTAAPAADHVLTISYTPTNNSVHLSVAVDPAFYYILEHSDDVRTFSAIAMALGQDGPTWDYAIPVGAHAGFFRLKVLGVFDGVDTDGDGIDDVYELQHPQCLNPLDPTDAQHYCLDPSYSNYQIYLRDRYGSVAAQFYGRENTVFNAGAPTARLEGFSKEVSIYNAKQGSSPPATSLAQIFSREAAIWNFGSPSAPIEAISSEVSVYNGRAGSAPPATDIAQVFSREAAVFNLGSGDPMNQALSRECTVFNTGPGDPAKAAISREVSVMNFLEPTSP